VTMFDSLEEYYIGHCLDIFNILDVSDISSVSVMMCKRGEASTQLSTLESSSPNIGTDSFLRSQLRAASSPLCLMTEADAVSKTSRTRMLTMDEVQHSILIAVV
jgi:hypothetical protein